MQCPACAFENMPGMKACARCGAQLVAEVSDPQDLRPPRAGSRKKRHFQYALNRLIDKFPKTRPVWLRWLDTGFLLPSHAVASMVWSVVPGLGHLMADRRKAAFVSLGVWLLIFTVGVNFYPGTRWWMAAGLMASWHAQVAFDAGGVARFTTGAFQRIRVLLICLVAVFVLYSLCDRAVRSVLPLMANRTTVTGLDLIAGDTVYVHEQAYLNENLQRGDVVAFRARNFRFDLDNSSYHGGGFAGRMVGPVLAVPGDEVMVEASRLRVNGEILPSGLLAENLAPFPTKDFTFTVDPGRFFIPYPLTEGDIDTVILEFLWTDGYQVKREHIEGRVDGVAFPLWRQHDFASVLEDY